jgi:uncharacterized protein (DUF2235 family)
MKRIAIFCDGTWNSPFIEVPTNVYLLSKASARSDDQKVIYQAGVGTENGRWQLALSKWIHKIGGGAFGWGLSRNVKAAYVQVAEIFEPGDELFIFGFSRGAYTARSLAGMIRKCGLIPKDKLSGRRLAKAWKLYRKSGDENRPSADHIRAERLSLSPVFCTDTADLELRNGAGHMVNIAYLGVWDTVGALGIPESLLGPIARWNNRKYEFHDMELSSLVKSARHAVALDERRVFYKPALWDNLDHVKPGRTPLNKDDRSSDRPYQQLWFIGDHGMIGGSNPERRLVAYPLDWITARARELGLALADGVRIPDGVPDAQLQTNILDVPNPLPALQEWRSGPKAQAACHASAITRAQRADLVYNPKSLAFVMAELRHDDAPPQPNRVA